MFSFRKKKEVITDKYSIDNQNNNDDLYNIDKETKLEDFFNIEENDLNKPEQVQEIVNTPIQVPTMKVQESVISEEKEILLIYNSDDYQLKTFGIQFLIFDNQTQQVVVDKTITPDKVVIWKYRSAYALLDIYSSTSDITYELKNIKNIFTQTAANTYAVARVYPDINNEECYINCPLHPMPEQIYDIAMHNTTSKRILSQILIKKDISIYNNKNKITDINVPFEDIVKQNVELTSENITFINDLYDKQKSPNWFAPAIPPTRPSERVKQLQAQKKKATPKTPQVETVVTGESEIFDPSILKVIEGSSNPMADMEKIIGLDNIKHEIEKLKYTLEYREERRQRGIYDSSASSMHMCFYGSPGTGKTTIARIMTGLLYEMGYIKENKCVEINGLEFKGGYVGQTEIITKGILDYSKGGILFVDEAYALCSNLNDTYGQEAVNTFIKEMEDNRDNLIIIFAGYEKAMENFLEMNSGFRSRINRYFRFQDYSTEELMEILLKQLQKKHLKIDVDALEKCMKFFKKAQQYNDFGNGRFVVNFIEKIEETHIMNVSYETNTERIDTIKLVDIDDKTCDNLIIALKK